MTIDVSAVRVTLVETMDDACALLSWLGQRRPANKIGCDTESTGLNKQTDYARTVQFGDQTHGWTIPVEDWKGLVKEVFAKFDGEIIGHNFPFDEAMLRNAGIAPPPRVRVHDTRPMHHALESTYSTALKNLASRYVDPRASAPQSDLDDAIKRYGWAGVPVNFTPYWVYAAMDPVWTVALDDVIRPRMLVDCPRAYELELATSWVTNDIERYGIHVDKVYAEQSFTEFMRFVEESAEWCKTTYGVSPGSNQAVVDALHDAGFTITKTTATGRAALDKEVLEGIDHPLAQTVLRRRQLQKLAKTYLRHFIDEADADDLIHCSINSIGARTGRMSVQNPALQTLPRRSEKNSAAITIRNCITARPGHTLLMCDFDQIEMRILAYLSRDPGMLAAFTSGDDFFTGMACQLFGLSSMKKKDPRRQITKNGCYAKVYGAGVPKFARTAGVTTAEASDFMQSFDEMFSSVSKFITNVQTRAMQRFADEGVPYVRSPMTQRRHIADVGKEYALVNYLIQGFAAEVFKTKVLEIDAAGMGQWLTMLVHDEVVMDVPNEHVEEAVYTLGRIMNDMRIVAPVPVTASVSFGSRWGEKSDWDPDAWRATVNR